MKMLPYKYSGKMFVLKKKSSKSETYKYRIHACALGGPVITRRDPWVDVEVFNDEDFVGSLSQASLLHSWLSRWLT
jgi:hypothetical protein